MAIRRCPYCKAIIEEGAEFCSNCGTQLLFPEDEKIEEEIPGEKIVDDDSDDDDEEDETEPPEEEPPLLNEEEVEATEPVKKKTDKSVDFQDVEVIQEPPEDSEEGKDASDDIHLEEQEVRNEELEEEIDLEEEWSEEKIHEEESVEISLEGIDEEEVIKEIEKETHSDSKEEVLKIEDLEKTVESSEIEKQGIDRFINSMRQEQGVDITSIPFQKEPLEDLLHKDEDPVIEKAIKEKPYEEKVVEDSPPHSPTPPLFEKQVIVPPTDKLPAWASKIKEKPSSSIPMTEEEKEFVPQEKTSSTDTGMGLPEVVAQKDLPFKGETKETKEEKPKEPPSQFSTRIKSRIFDVLFIAAVWFVTTWIASYVMEVKLFKLISAAALLLVVFYVVLLSAYLSLFLFFLGETLGDYLFDPKHRSRLHHPA